MRNFRAIAARESVETDEGWMTRVFPPGCFEWGDGTWPMTVHHDDERILGRIDRFERLGDLILAYGILDDEGVGADADWRRDIIRQIDAQIINSVSVEPCGLDVEEKCTATDEDGYCTALRVTFTRYKLGAASVVTIPGIEGTLIELDPVEAPIAAVASVTIESIPDVIPAEWLTEPANLPDLSLGAPSRVPQFTEDGHVFGWVCGWTDCHVAFPTHCQTPWHSEAAYAYALHCGPFDVDDGTQVRLAPLAVQGGHYPTAGAAGRQWQSAQAHYDDPTATAAYVVVGENEGGVWFSGALRPGVTPEQINLLARHQLSGDWRRIGGAMELVGMCSVNIPGFIRQLAMVASAEGAEELVAAVIASGGARQRAAHDACSCGGTCGTCAAAPTIEQELAGILAVPDELVTTRLDRIESMLATLTDTLGPDVRERLRARLVAAS